MYILFIWCYVSRCWACFRIDVDDELASISHVSTKYICLNLLFPIQSKDKLIDLKTIIRKTKHLFRWFCINKTTIAASLYSIMTCTWFHFTTISTGFNNFWKCIIWICSDTESHRLQSHRFRCFTEITHEFPPFQETLAQNMYHLTRKFILFYCEFCFLPFSYYHNLLHIRSWMGNLYT